VTVSRKDDKRKSKCSEGAGDTAKQGGNPGKRGQGLEGAYGSVIRALVWVDIHILDFCFAHIGDAYAASGRGVSHEGSELERGRKQNLFQNLVPGIGR
jgi:hypothetical protein